MQWMYANYLKRETNPNKKWNLVRMSLEHTTLPLLAPLSTDWASEPLDRNVLQINNFYATNKNYTSSSNWKWSALAHLLRP